MVAKHNKFQLIRGGAGSMEAAQGACTTNSAENPANFNEELNFFKAHQKEFMQKYPGKTLVLIKKEIVGIYDSIMQAYMDALKKYEPGSFMIQPCIPGPDAYSVTISSNEIFR